MNCKECRDTRIYQPLIGPSEPCRACQYAGITWGKSYSNDCKEEQETCIAQRSGNAHIKSLGRTLMNLTTSVNSVGKVLKTKIPADWSMDQKRVWGNLLANFNTLEYTILQMSDGKDEL